MQERDNGGIRESGEGPFSGWRDRIEEERRNRTNQIEAENNEERQNRGRMTEHSIYYIANFSVITQLEKERNVPS